MYALLFVLFTATSADHGVRHRAQLCLRQTGCQTPASHVVLVADGSGEWSGRAAGRIVEELKAKLEPGCSLKIIWFDGDPLLQTGSTITGAHRDLVVVSPQVPMREAMELGVASLLDTPAPRTMVVIAQTQFYPTSVSTRRLLGSLRETQTRVHGIHIAPPPGRSSMLHRFGGLSRSGFVWVVETLALGKRSYAGRPTARLQKMLAEASGGKFCMAGPQSDGTNCVEEVASEMVGIAATVSRLPAKQ